MPTDTQARLIAVWAKVLQAPDITPDSNFVALGGDSLDVVTVLSLIHEEFSILVSFADFLEAETLADLARDIELSSIT
jgi:acyl carrier protein